MKKFFFKNVYFHWHLLIVLPTRKAFKTFCLLSLLKTLTLKNFKLSTLSYNYYTTYMLTLVCSEILSGIRASSLASPKTNFKSSFGGKISLTGCVKDKLENCVGMKSTFLYRKYFSKMRFIFNSHINFVIFNNLNFEFWGNTDWTGHRKSGWQKTVVAALGSRTCHGQ